jgi:hypothetical protein
LDTWKLVKLEVKIDLLEVKYPSETGAEQKLWKWPYVLNSLMTKVVDLIT